MMPKQPPSKPRPLRPWLLANALFSIASGGAMALASGRLPTLLGAGGATLYLILGVGLVLYGGRLWILTRRDVAPLEGWAVVAGDLLWVAGSVALLAAGAFTPVGAWIVAAVAAVIAIFAVGQGAAIVRASHGKQGASVSAKR